MGKSSYRRMVINMTELHPYFHENFPPCGTNFLKGQKRVGFLDIFGYNGRSIIWKGLTMKKSYSELIYLLLSLIVLGLFAIIYITKGQPKVPQSPQKPKVTQTSSSKADPKFQAFLEELETVENQPTLASFEQVQANYQALPDGSEKEALSSRLNALTEEVDRIRAAEEQLVLAETTGYQLDIDQAQAAISALKTPTTKEQLQERLNTFITNLTGQVPE